jgi:hypothetical protein
MNGLINGMMKWNVEFFLVSMINDNIEIFFPVHSFLFFSIFPRSFIKKKNKCLVYPKTLPFKLVFFSDHKFRYFRFILKMSSKNALAAIQTMKIIYGSHGRQNILPYHYLG